MYYICIVFTLPRYAREDTHYLLYIYDVMRRQLISESSAPDPSDTLLAEVCTILSCSSLISLF